jgi:hypothetical protein
MGLFTGLSSPVSFSLVQVHIPGESLGRLFDGLMTLLGFGQPVGMALGGAAAGARGTPGAYLGASLIIGLVEL